MPQPGPPLPSHSGSPPDIYAALLDLFGFREFRPGQREVIDAVLAGRDALAVMPTGQGKSLCYQLPAARSSSLTIVVSPLIALMKDQVDGLRARGIAAAAVHSGVVDRERDQVIQNVRLGRIRLLYLAPERVQHDWLMGVLRAAYPSLLVVDEAHCISRWGHDFRRDYLRLRELRTRLGEPACLALTATATPKVQEDICARLDLRDPARVVTGFRRPNLHLAVRSCHTEGDKRRALVQLLEESEVRDTPGSVLIYCATRRHVEDVTAFLRAEVPGIQTEPATSTGLFPASRGTSQSSALSPQSCLVGHYHAGLTDEERTDRQERFLDGRIRILVATNAFGMGIDKPDVRLVIHYDLPGSIEAYYQEAGRAGRDGRPAQCVLLFQRRDIRIQEYLNERSADQEGARGEERRALLDAIVRYATGTGCRQLAVLDYFGDAMEAAGGPCGQCDRCVGSRLSRRTARLTGVPDQPPTSRRPAS